MRLGGAAFGTGPGARSSRGRREPGSVQGPLDGPQGRHLLRGERLKEVDADDAGTPGRVLGLEVTRRPGHLGVAAARLGLTTPRIARGDGLGSLLLEAGHELADGQRVEAQVGGDVLKVMPLLLALEDDLTLRDGEGATHEKSACGANQG